MKQLAIIFDLDGTLIDSESLAEVAWERALHRLGVTFLPEHVPLMLGMQLDIAIDNVKQHFELSESADAIFRVLATEWTQLTHMGLPAMAGVYELVDELDRRGILWGVATNSDHSYAVGHLEHVKLAHRAGAIVGADDVRYPKPAPDVFTHCADLLGVVPQNCIAVEDSFVGHQAAAAAGMIVVVVGDVHSADFPHANYIFPSLHVFLEKLDRFTV